MPAKWHKYSYSAQLEERRAIFAFIVLVISILVVFTIVHHNLVTMYEVKADTMAPVLEPGDCVLSTPLYSNEPREKTGFSPLIPPSRGDLVVIDPAYPDDAGGLLRLANAFVSFATFQKIHLAGCRDSSGEMPVIRRLVAFPGDSIYLKDFILHVKPAGSSHYLTEFELSPEPYDLTLAKLPEGWSDTLPLSGSFPEMTLPEGQFFVLCDTRLSASDSRVWGTVDAKRVRGKVLLRYWPFSRFGKL
jgi:signal peptidase I